MHPLLASFSDVAGACGSALVFQLPMVAGAGLFHAIRRSNYAPRVPGRTLS